MPIRAIATAALGLALCAPLHAITIDGRLDEPQWAGAQRVDDFRVVQPLTLEEPELRTELLVHSDERGLYFGMRMQQPPEVPRTRHRTARDAQARADRVNVIVDFDGRGSTAYEFTVSISGGIQDAIINNQRSFSYDWDGLWFHAVHEGEDYWSVEIHLPWAVAPMGPVVDGKREIGVYASRVVEGQGQRFSWPAYDFDRPTFVADMGRLRVDAWNRASLDLLPYVSYSHDRLGGDHEARAGIDLFWRPSGRHQLSATLFPDFGQVEGDDLVVNFSAIETFFSEKRPFFTENQSLFDLGTSIGGRLVNTRRIGAAPDAGPEGSSEIAGAVKYTGSGGSADWGLFTAVEEDGSEASGRDFLVLRARHRGERLRLGWLGTRVERPTLQRSAEVDAVDLNWFPGRAASVRALLVNSRVDERAPGAAGRRSGWGGWGRVDIAPDPRWAQRFELSAYDRDYNINDAGFMQRNNVRELVSGTNLYRRSYPDDSPLQNSSWYIETIARDNFDGERILAQQYVSRSWRFRSTANAQVYLLARAAAHDDLITRGNGSVLRPPRHEARVSFDSPRIGDWRTYLHLRWLQEGVDGWGRELVVEPTWFARHDLSTGLRLAWLDSDDWLIWRGGDRLASYARTQGSASWNLNWFPADRHEVRWRAQYIGLRADARRSYRVVDRRLQPEALSDADFSLGTLAMQLRYRYEFAPLSELFLVWSRGGAAELEDEQTGFGGLFGQTRVGVVADQVLMKLRYRF